MGKPFKTVKVCQVCGSTVWLNGKCVPCEALNEMGSATWTSYTVRSKPTDATMPPPISPEASNLANLISSLTGFTAAQEYRVAEAIEAGLREQREIGMR